MSIIRRCPTRVFGALAAACLVALSAIGQAAPQTSFPWLRDMQVTLYARRALTEEPSLARLNLGVNVRDGIATVWGPVPNGDIGKQAVKKVEQARGVLQVRCDLYILGPKKDAELIDMPFVFETPTKSESALPNRESGKIGNLTGRPNPLAPEDALMPGLQATVSLLPPLAIREAAEPALLAAVVKEPIDTAINRLRGTDARFRPIATELRDGGTVLLRGGTARGEDVMAFAQAISRLWGVERVVVTNNP